MACLEKSHPYHPWKVYIYFHLLVFLTVNVGIHIAYMDLMGQET